MTSLRVGVIGIDYSHVFGALRALKECELGSLVAATIDDKPALEDNRKKLIEITGLEKIYYDYIEMLDKEELDVVFNYTNHLLRAPATKAAAEHGLHIMTEKPMAYNLKDADVMLQAAVKNSVKLMCNWIIAWSPAYRKTYDLVNSCAVGNVFHIRYRLGHSGPKNETLTNYNFRWMGTNEGGGAYMDFCCYGAALARWLLGIPKEVFGTTSVFVKSFLPSNDNGILVLMYDKGTAVLEGTWSQIGRIPSPYWDLQVFGSKGTILMDGPFMRESVKIFTDKNSEGENIELSEPSRGERNGVEYFLTCIKEDKPIEGLCSAKFSRDTQEILEAGIISSKTKRTVSMPVR